MFTALVVYTISPIILSFLSDKIKNFKNNDKKILLVLLSLLFALVFGLRYNVGVDYLSYLEQYNTGYIDNDISSDEFGFRWLNSLLHFINMPYPVAFISYAFIQFYFIVKGLRDKELLPFVIIFYFLTTYIFFSFNGIRQSMAFSIIFFSLQFIKEKKIIKYILWIVIAALFHKSAIIFLPLYFILDKEYFSNRIIQLILLIIFFILSPYLQSFLWNILPLLSRVVLREELTQVQLDLIKNVDWGNGGLGLGNYLWLIINCSIIVFYHRVKQFFPTYFNIYYNLFFVGSLLTYIVGSTYLSRINVYFENYKIFILAMFFWYLCHSKSNKGVKLLVSMSILLGLLLFYYVAILKGAGLCAPFQFIKI